MNWSVRKRQKGELNLPLIYAAVAGLTGGFLWFLDAMRPFPYIPCPFKTLTGYPCPTCGATRLSRNLVKWRLLDSFSSNPLLFIAGILFVLWAAYGVWMWVSGKKAAVSFSSRESRIIRILMVVLVLVNWLYLILSGK